MHFSFLALPSVFNFSFKTVYVNVNVCVDEELSTLKGIDNEAGDEKPPQQVNMHTKAVLPVIECNKNQVHVPAHDQC